MSMDSIDKKSVPLAVLFLMCKYCIEIYKLRNKSVIYTIFCNK